MSNLRKIVLFVFILNANYLLAQIYPDSLKQDISEILDSLYIDEVQNAPGKEKVLHAEPLFIDLIRDLGARKGEKEWNVGMGITDNLRFDSYNMLVEYEFAPVDRLGLEIEIPVTIYARQNGTPVNDIPPNRIESLKMAGQYSFFVSTKLKTSMALGYINELEFSSLNSFGHPLFTGNIYNPFLIIAKRWGNNFHTLIYSGAKIDYNFRSKHSHKGYEINSNFHYMISGTRNFLGLEINKAIYKDDFDMIMRPQIRVGIAENFLLGLVTGIPVNRENQRLSMFMRIIWEPGFKKH